MSSINFLDQSQGQGYLGGKTGASPCTGDTELDTLASTPSAGTSTASPLSQKSKKPRRTKVEPAAQPPTLTAADVVDHWLVGARLPSTLRYAHRT